MIIKPIVHCIILFPVKLHINWLKGLHFQNVVSIIKGRLFIIKWWESHSLKVPSISFLPPHHDPHCTPLSNINWFDNLRNLVNKSDGSCDVIENLHISDLFPRHWDILKELVDGMRGILEGSKMDSFVGSVFSAR